ncbi:MAG: alpha/beta hydrolase-fold protein [Verrucomicrobiota bacterium]
MRLLLLPLFLLSFAAAAEPDFPLTADSQPQTGVPKGTMIKDSYKAVDDGAFPGTEREYQIYLPAGYDQTEPSAFMVFQDGVIYQAPVVFDNLIARKDMPPLVGIFIKPGVVPAANDNALPRYNRSYEYDSITPTYSEFLINEFLPAIESKHGLKLSTDPNQAAISGNSSGGICAFMVAWHRPDRFRRVFTGVGTYVGIHGADQLPVLVRKFEPKPLRVFLQSGTGDNNLYCGDWWMANQMMERSLTWAGYDVNHAWGEGGHNQKHASQIFPEVLRWLWRDWQTTMEVRANPRGDSKWKGYEVVGDGEWQAVNSQPLGVRRLTSDKDGTLFFYGSGKPALFKLTVGASKPAFLKLNPAGYDSTFSSSLAVGRDGRVYGSFIGKAGQITSYGEDSETTFQLAGNTSVSALCITHDGKAYFGESGPSFVDLTLPKGPLPQGQLPVTKPIIPRMSNLPVEMHLTYPGSALCLSPDQSLIYACDEMDGRGYVFCWQRQPDGTAAWGQKYFQLERTVSQPTAASGLCVDTNGWLYVATSLGIQVLDQAGRVNFIIPTPKQPYDVCMGGKDLSELFIACGKTIYKRATKAKGVVSGQQAPIKPPAPKL